MKKIICLTSVLALTACATGGNGGGNPGEIVTPSNYVDRVAQSNANITGMISNSEYQVAKYVANKLGDDAESVNLSRAATVRSAFQPSNPNSGNMDYDTARELVDLAGWLVDETTSETDIVEMFNKSTLDKNKIKVALKLMGDEYCFVGGNAQTTAERIKSRQLTFQIPLKDLQQKTEVFNLKDVSFKTIPTSGVISELKFHVNDKTGEVESIEFVNAQEIMDTHEGSEVPVGPIMRDGKTRVFNQTDEYEGKNVTIPYEYISYAKQLGLKYSDFGILETDLTKNEIAELRAIGVYATPFVGGYDSKKVNNEEMKTLTESNGNMEFSGLAKGTVSYHDWYTGTDDTGSDITLEGGLSDPNAKLTFKQDGTQVLSADFLNWAQIEAVKSSDGINQFKVIENHTSTDSPYYIETSSDSLVDGDMSGEYNMIFQTGYYGDNGVPTEAVGLVQYQHAWGDTHHVESQNRDDVEHHINVDLGFGGKM